MNELRGKALDAQGGIERWAIYHKVEATIVTGGSFFAQRPPALGRAHA